MPEFYLKPINRDHIKNMIIVSSVISLFFALKFFIWYDIFECPFYSLTGFYCPGCGGTRSIINLLHGDIFTALKCNLLIVVTLISIPFILPVLLRQSKTKILQICFNVKYLTLILILITFFSIIRNISLYPFTILKP